VIIPSPRTAVATGGEARRDHGGLRTPAGCPKGRSPQKSAAEKGSPPTRSWQASNVGREQQFPATPHARTCRRQAGSCARTASRANHLEFSPVAQFSGRHGVSTRPSATAGAAGPRSVWKESELRRRRK